MKRLKLIASCRGGLKRNFRNGHLHKKVFIHKMQMKTSLLLIKGLSPNRLIRRSHVIVAKMINYSK